MKMTKKDLVWRLKERPSVSEISSLVADKIITQEEARSLLFNENSTLDDSEKLKALQKQIEFLEGLVKELSKNQHITTVPVYIDRYIERWRPTYNPIWLSVGSSLAGSGKITATSSTNTTLNNYTQRLIG